MKSLLSLLFVFYLTSLSYSQFNGITNVGQGLIIPHYGNVAPNNTSFYPLADTITTAYIYEDVWDNGFDNNINATNPKLYWTINVSVLPAIDSSAWRIVPGVVESGSVEGSANDRLRFDLHVGTDPGQIPPGTNIMYYIRATSGSTERFALASGQDFPSGITSLDKTDLWQLRFNGHVTYNTKRMDAEFFDWQPNERIDTLQNATNGEQNELRASWNANYLYLYIDKITGWTNTDNLIVYLDVDNDTNNNGKLGVTINGLTPTLPITYDYVAFVRPTLSTRYTDIRTYANRNVGGVDTVPLSFSFTNAILELEIPRDKIASLDTNATIRMFVMMENESGDIFTTWPSTMQDISGTADGGMDFTQGTLQWFNFRMAPNQVPAIPESILPVELTSFTAKVNENKILLNWITASEVNNYGFDIEKKYGNSDWQKIGFLRGAGSCNTPNHYSYIDADIIKGNQVKYRLKQIDNNGSFKYSPVVEVKVGNFINGFVLDQNYPNPFNPSTIIKFGFERETRAQLKIYDILGKEVAELFNEQADAGRVYNINFNGSNLASGIYYYKLTGNNNTEIKKMILIK